jgi:hypothetical protein
MGDSFTVQEGQYFHNAATLDSIVWHSGTREKSSQTKSEEDRKYFHTWIKLYGTVVQEKKQSY